jgi:hypothetical protein
VLVGLLASYGDWMDSVRLICRPIAADGSLGSEYIIGFVGGTGGVPHTHRCPSGMAVAGLGGTSGLYVNSIMLRCQPWDTQARGISTSGGTVIEITGSQITPASAERQICSPNQLATGLVGKAGIYVDSVELQCLAK